MTINFNKAEFVLSATTQNAFIRDGRPQVTFAGRSNVGKSSVRKMRGSTAQKDVRSRYGVTSSVSSHSTGR